MNAGEIKKKASEFFTEYLNHTIDNCCGNETTAEGIDDFFPLDVLKNTNRFSDTLKDHSQEMVELFLHTMAPHSSTLAWKIPWTEEPGRLQSMGSLRVGHD